SALYYGRAYKEVACRPGAISKSRNHNLLVAVTPAPRAPWVTDRGTRRPEIGQRRIYDAVVRALAKIAVSRAGEMASGSRPNAADRRNSDRIYGIYGMDRIFGEPCLPDSVR